MKSGRILEKLGRFNTVLLVTAGSTVLSVLTSLIGFWLSGMSPSTFGMAMAIITPMIVAPAASWYLVGLLFRIRELEQQASKLATYDALTDIMNRRAFLQSAESAFRLSQIQRSPLALIFIDLDFFKSVNDTHGHAAGDLVLRSAAVILNNSKRKSDLVARFGGEEFILLLPGTELAGALYLAEQLRLAFKKDELHFSGKLIRYGASLGVACLDQGDPADLEKLIKQADQALYEAKASGRDKVVAYSSPQPQGVALN
jgi:diguanylate cyclase (GGDEF)-like protein